MSKTARTPQTAPTTEALTSKPQSRLITDFYGVEHDLDEVHPFGKHGLSFRISDDVWNIADSPVHNPSFGRFSELPSLFVDRLKFICSRKFSLNVNSISSMLAFFNPDEMGIHSQSTDLQITETAVEKWVIELHNKDIEPSTFNNILHTSRQIAKWSHQFLRPEERLFTEEARKKLDAIVGKKVVSKRHSDPKRGRFSAATLSLLDQKIRSAWNGGETPRISREEYLMYTMLRILGARPAQLMQVKCKDFIRPTDNSGAYALDLFHLKDGNLPRTESTRFTLDLNLAKLISAHITETGLQPDDALFKFSSIPLRTKNYHMQGELLGHIDPAHLKDVLKDIAQRLDIPFAVNSRRFRDTVGTRFYHDLGPAIAGKFLTHKSSTSIESYADIAIMQKNFDGILEQIHGKNLNQLQIAKAILNDPESIDVVGMFTGEVIDGKGNHEPIEHSEGDLAAAGECGTRTECGRGLPYACYSCDYMRAYEFGPHRAYLEHTIAEYLQRQRNKDETAIDLLRPIYGMAKVISIISERSQQRAKTQCMRDPAGDKDE